MSLLFTAKQIGGIEIGNRFVHSATYEAMAEESGKVSERMIERYKELAEGGVGLIIPGFIYVHPLGKSTNQQAGIHSDEMIPRLKEMVNAVHIVGGKIAFQLTHAGRHTSKEAIGETPMGPSSKGRDPIFLVKPREMTEDDIWGVIEAFSAAAGRAAAAGADGVQLHAAHGYLINQFLSPFFNNRTDTWGGSDENQFRLLKEVILRVKGVLPDGMFLAVKLSSNDYTPKEGVTPGLSAKYSGWLADIGIDALEVSCGTFCYSKMNISRGEVPLKGYMEAAPIWKRPLVWFALKGMVGKYDLEEGYNLEAAKTIKPALGGVPLMLVGGLRRISHMEGILDKGYADFMSMSRPFIREPSLVNKFKEGKSEAASCISCNKCDAAVLNGKPLSCYRGS